MKDWDVRSILFLPCLCVWAIVATAQGTDGNIAPAVARLVLELSDGSRIVGTPAIDRFKMATEYANLEIPLPLLRMVEFSGTNHVARVNFQNGDLLSVQLPATEIALKTVFGQVAIPMADVRRIMVGGMVKSLPEGLVLHYTFDVDEGERVTDMSDGGNHGKVHGATYTSEGKVGGAMSFNGDRQGVVVRNSASLQLQDFTIMAWIKRGSTDEVSMHTDSAEFFGYGRTGYIFGILANGHLFLSKVDINDVISQSEIHDQAFHHVAVTKQGSRIVFYLDGVAYPASDYNPGFEFDTDAAVGARGDNLAGCFIGVIDEVAVFNRRLSGDEVKGIYDSQK